MNMGKLLIITELGLSKVCVVNSSAFTMGGMRWLMTAVDFSILLKCVGGRVNKILQNVSKPYCNYLESCLFNQNYLSSLDTTPGMLFLGLDASFDIVLWSCWLEQNL